MGLQDRDYWKERSRTPNGGSRPAPARRRVPGLSATWRPWLTWLAILGVGVLAAKALLDWRDRRPFPPTGAVHWYVEVPAGVPLAPLSLRAPAGRVDFAVRLDDWVSGDPVALVPVRAGETARLQVPLGRYRLTIEKGLLWRSPERAFALSGDGRRSDVPLDFHRIGDSVHGHAIQLETLAGNLPTSMAP